MSLNQLKVEEVEEIFKKIYENACELLEDAELLFNNKKYARAYLCSHIAFEEFGKLPMLNTVALDIHYGKKVDWKKLNRRFRDHRSKITQSYSVIMSILNDFLKSKGYSIISLQAVLDYREEIINYIQKDFSIDVDSMVFSLFGNGEELKAAENPMEIIQSLNDYKNGSLYSDFKHNSFTKPSENIDEDICLFGITLTMMQKSFIEIPEYHLKGFEVEKIDEYTKTLHELIDIIVELKGKYSDSELQDLFTEKFKKDG